MLFQGKGFFFPGFRGIFIRNLFFLKQGVYPGIFRAFAELRDMQDYFRFSGFRHSNWGMTNRPSLRISTSSK